MNQAYGPWLPLAVAKERQLRFYCGAPCKYGHTGPRYVCNKACLQCVDNNRDSARERQRKWAAANPSKVVEHRRHFWLNRSEEQISRHRRQRAESARRNPATQQAWRKNNPEKVKEAQKKAREKRCSVSHALRQRLLQAIQTQNAKKGSKTRELIGCSYADLRKYLENLFQPGMSWENHGEWHIDHIRPCASFDLTDPEQQKQCFHFSNLQPLWAVENRRKNAKWLPDANAGAA